MPTQVRNSHGYHTCVGTSPPWAQLPHCTLLGWDTHPRLRLNVLPQKPLLVEGVPGFPRDGIDRAFVNLLLDGTD